MIPFNATQSAAIKTTSSSSEQPLIHSLQQQNQCLEQIIELLKIENEAIVQSDTEHMGKLLDKKLPLLSQLDQYDQERRQAFQQLSGQTYGDQAFSDFIEQHTSGIIQDLWQAIKLKLPECKDQNELNGRIISMRQKNTEQILQILSGRPANTSQTYSHLGQTSQQKRSALYTSV